MKEKPFFSIVIPSYNRRARLEQCLEALARQSYPTAGFEVVVIDDGSSDTTVDYLHHARFSYPFRFQRCENAGPAHARNVGTGMARGEFIAFTEDDVVPETEWLKNAAGHLSSGAIDVLEGRTVYVGTQKNVRRFDVEGLPSFVPCNLFVRRSALQAIGGFDEEFYDGGSHLYFREDADLGFRLLEKRNRIKIARDVVVAHPVQFATLKDCIRHSLRYMFDALLYRRHPVKFRQLIEVKRILGLTVHRPQHYVAWLCVLAWIMIGVSLLRGADASTIGLALVAFICSLLFRYKYQGRGALKLYRIHETVGFLFVPLVYYWSVIRGCVRYKSFAPLI